MIAAYQWYTSLIMRLPSKSTICLRNCSAIVFQRSRKIGSDTLVLPLWLLHERIDGKKANILCCSILLVHGLQGHPFKTWAYETTSGESSSPEVNKNKKKKGRFSLFFDRSPPKMNRKHMMMIPEV